MTEDAVRFHAQRALDAVETIDRTAKPRSPGVTEALVGAIQSARKHLFKLVGTNSAADISIKPKED